jgi:hypothetical protein
MPVLGAVKNAVEALRGRDFFPDRAPATAPGIRRVSAR